MEPASQPHRPGLPAGMEPASQPYRPGLPVIYVPATLRTPSAALPPSIRTEEIFDNVRQIFKIEILKVYFTKSVNL
jgi:hypothetical protein